MSMHAVGLALLVLVTVIWGSTFPIIKNATATLDPAQLLAWRFTFGLLPLLPFLFARRTPRPAASADAGTPTRRTERHFWRDGLMLGLWLIGGYATQTIGLQTTSANRAAFITGLSVVMVPLWLAFTAGRKLEVRLWGAAGCAVLGIALLSWEGGRLVIGDLWVLGCAVTYAGYILALERVAPHWRALPLTAVQITFTALLAWTWALTTGNATLPPPEAWAALVYLGLVATAATTLMQTIGQKHVSAPEAAVIYALEPVTASVFSFLLLGETVGARGVVGGALVVAAMVLSQLPSREDRDRAGPVHDRGLAD
jgi:drug/metabolite transporter (DMT)-like permease